MAGKQRPRPFIPLDIDYFQQDTVRDLLAAFGPAGPCLFVALLLEARRQANAGSRYVEMRYRALGSLVRCTADEAEAVVALAAELGLVALHEAPAGAFKLESLKRSKWESTDPGAAERMRAKRARDANGDGSTNV